MTTKNKFEALLEYVTLSQTDNKGKMQGETQKGPTRMTLQDIVNSNRKTNQIPEDSPADNIPLPAPLTPAHLSVLADVYANISDLSSHTKKAAENPSLSNNKKKTAIEDIHEKLNKVLKLIMDMEDDLDKLGIDR